MARSPAELLKHQTEKDARETDRLEAGIDRKLDEEYAGGVFVFTHYDGIPLRVRDALQDRYREWTLGFEERSGTQYNETNYVTTVTMTPVPF